MERRQAGPSFAEVGEAGVPLCAQSQPVPGILRRPVTARQKAFGHLRGRLADDNRDLPVGPRLVLVEVGVHGDKPRPQHCALGRISRTREHATHAAADLDGDLRIGLKISVPEGVFGSPPCEATSTTRSPSRRKSRGWVRGKPLLHPLVVTRQTGTPRGKALPILHLPPTRPPVARYTATLNRDASLMIFGTSGESSPWGRSKRVGVVGGVSAMPSHSPSAFTKSPVSHAEPVASARRWRCRIPLAVEGIVGGGGGCA